MALLNPHKADFSNFDKPTQDIFQKTIQFFEKKGLGEMKKEDHEVVWYNDFLDFSDVVTLNLGSRWGV